MNKYASFSVRLIEGDGEKKSKTWQARLRYKDATGKWKEKSKMLNGAKGIREAKQMAREYMDKLNAEADIMPTIKKEKTVDDVFIEYIKKQLETGEIERSTYSNTLYSYNKYIKPCLGEYIFHLVDRAIIEEWIKWMYQLGLSQNTIHTTYSRLKKVYNYYFNIDILKKDPFKGVKMPKRGEAKITHLTREQMDDVLTAVYTNYTPDHPMYVGILLALYTGLRRGEICGLRWNDINFTTHTITVRTAVGVSEGDGLGDYTKSPKNKSSNRTFPIVSQIEEALLARKSIINPKNNWFVVGDKDQFMRPQHYNRLFSEFVDRNELVDAYGNKIVPHGLRHNFATVGIRGGIDIASLSLMMGHASRAMTLDTYGDANADALILASSKLNDTFNRDTDYFATEEDKEE
ncbi:MAG: tyrosine-type recombinase/integrase [Christensenellales bacterium]